MSISITQYKIFTVRSWTALLVSQLVIGQTWCANWCVDYKFVDHTLVAIGIVFFISYSDFNGTGRCCL